MQEELVYPVYSRRSEGISVGIDLFPDAKQCSFDCPYCEVHPFFHPTRFSKAQLKQELTSVLSRCIEAGEQVRDIAIAGHGEPLLSPQFTTALTVVLETKQILMPNLPLVIITNALSLGSDAILNVLTQASTNHEIHIWAKLDAGTNEHFYRMSGLDPTIGAFEKVQAGILSASKRLPVILQTMLASINGFEPDEHELTAYRLLVQRFLGQGAIIERIDLYTVSRKPVIRSVCPLNDTRMLLFADFLASGLANIPIRVFGKTTRLR